MVVAPNPLWADYRCDPPAAVKLSLPMWSLSACANINSMTWYCSSCERMFLVVHHLWLWTGSHSCGHKLMLCGYGKGQFLPNVFMDTRQIVQYTVPVNCGGWYTLSFCIQGRWKWCVCVWQAIPLPCSVPQEGRGHAEQMDWTINHGPWPPNIPFRWPPVTTKCNLLSMRLSQRECAVCPNWMWRKLVSTSKSVLLYYFLLKCLTWPRAELHSTTELLKNAPFVFIPVAHFESTAMEEERLYRKLESGVIFWSAIGINAF